MKCLIFPIKYQFSRQNNLFSRQKVFIFPPKSFYFPAKKKIFPLKSFYFPAKKFLYSRQKFLFSRQKYFERPTGDRQTRPTTTARFKRITLTRRLALSGRSGRMRDFRTNTK
jgi:hypothetical protein